MTFTLAIVGKPNVGKSTLFNRLVGKKIAIVDNQAGVTRDIREAETKLGKSKYKVVDTAGLEDAREETLQFRMSSFSLRAVEQANACIFLVDAKVGITVADQTYAELLRRKAKNIIVVANKIEGFVANIGFYETFSLGLGTPIGISAEHGLGMDELYERLTDLLNSHFDSNLINKKSVREDYKKSISDEKEIHISIIGRPNSGKSTLINKILGEDRLLTGPESGITRDSIGISTDWMGKKYRIIDTAGIRKKAKVQEKLEKLSVADSIQAIKFSEVVVLLLDVQTPFDSQDLKIADFTAKEGRSIVIAVNKWDLEKDKSKKISHLKQRLKVLLPQLSGVPLVVLSAITGYGLGDLNKTILDAFRIWNIRISTSRLNGWLAERLENHPPPAFKGKRVKMRYITQIKSRPPTFVIFSSVVKGVPESYKRYIVNGLRSDFYLQGTPIRLILRSGSNPYEKKNKSL